MLQILQRADDAKWFRCCSLQVFMLMLLCRHLCSSSLEFLCCRRKFNNDWTSFLPCPTSLFFCFSHWASTRVRVKRTKQQQQQRWSPGDHRIVLSSTQLDHTFCMDATRNYDLLLTCTQCMRSISEMDWSISKIDYARRSRLMTFSKRCGVNSTFFVFDVFPVCNV